jgi:lipopolysaccharide/colanic/teichoic acid biosynthesis glycosyltransferase
MHWGHPKREKVALFLGDITLLLLCAFAGWYLHPASAGNATQKFVSLLVLLPAYVAAIYVFDLYSLDRLNRLGTLARVILAVGAGSGFGYIFFHLIRWRNPHYRAMELSALILCAATYAWRRFYFQSFRRFQLPEELLAVGSTKDAEILRGAVDQVHPHYHLCGLLNTEAGGSQGAEKPEDLGLLTGWSAGAPRAYAYAFSPPGSAVGLACEPASSLPVPQAASWRAGNIRDLGPATSENLLRVVVGSRIGVVVVRNDSMTSELAGVLTRLRFSGIRVHSLLDFCMRASEQLPLGLLNVFWLCVADGFDLLHARLFRRVKRLTDLFLAGAGLLAAWPFMLLAAVAIRIDSPGPILFRQRRVGWKGRPFELLKFRSMRPEAEKEGGPQWASANDPRVTKVGNILRKLHFDELPQMINILRGEMSFVGPRPERPEFVRLLNESINFYHLRHYVLPGITGWAQVNYPYGSSLEDARRKLEYDLYYICNASPLLDLRTLLRTARVVLFRQGSR